MTTITEFRKELFHLADEALNGEHVAFTYRGVVFQVIPETKKSKVEKLIGQTVLAEGADFENSGKELFAEMEAEWQKDWSDL